MRIGYFMSSEECGAADLITQARLAEQAGFDCLWISDHFHPWNSAQGNSDLVWATIGALSQVTSLPVATAVTCPTIRTHPAIIAQAAATAARLLPGGFALGVGSGEVLNEHVTGARWPSADQRLDMLEESIEVMRELWGGEYVYHRGRHYTVEDARLFSLPDAPPPVYVSGFGPKAAALAGRVGDGYVSTMPDTDLIRAFRDAGGAGKPMQAGYKVCWSSDKGTAVSTAHELWANEGLPGEMAQILPSPVHFEQASELVTEQMIADTHVCGDDVEAHVEAFRPFAEAGFDDIHVNQIGAARQATSAEGFFEFYAAKVLPRLRELG